MCQKKKKAHLRFGLIRPFSTCPPANCNWEMLWGFLSLAFSHKSCNSCSVVASLLVAPLTRLLLAQSLGSFYGLFHDNYWFSVTLRNIKRFRNVLLHIPRCVLRSHFVWVVPSSSRWRLYHNTESPSLTFQIHVCIYLYWSVFILQSTNTSLSTWPMMRLLKPVGTSDDLQ